MLLFIHLPNSNSNDFVNASHSDWKNHTELFLLDLVFVFAHTVADSYFGKQELWL